MAMSNIVIFTDGSSRGNPGPGGWGAIIADDARVREIGGAENPTTNNRMELKAVHEALLSLRGTSFDIDIYTDSSYVMKGATEWGRGWRRNNWITSTKSPVLNRDMWEPFLDLIDAMNAKIRWHNVGGHVGIPGNERVDVLATAFADGVDPDMYDGPRNSYPVDLTQIVADANLLEKKQSSKSGAKAYSYVSEIDGVVEVHQTWAQCEARVRGKKARFKKVFSESEQNDLVKAYSS